MSTSSDDTTDVLDDSSALALGIVSDDEAAQLYQHLRNSSTDIQHEYAAMRWAALHLPSAVPLVEPPQRVKNRLHNSLHNSLHEAHIQHHAEHAHQSHYIYDADEHTATYSIAAEEGKWYTHSIDGITVKPLATDKERGYSTLLMNIAAGKRYPAHTHTGAEQCYVISGDVHIGGKILGAGDFFSTRAGADHGDIFSTEGAQVLLVVALEDYRKTAWKFALNTLYSVIQRIVGTNR